MSWKYIMFRLGDQQLPVIFPGEFIHSEVAEAMFSVMMHMAARQKVNEAPGILSAGFVASVAVPMVAGGSETLRFESREEDAQIINIHPYAKGRESPMAMMTETMVLKAHMDMVLVRAQDLADKLMPSAGNADEPSATRNVEQCPQFEDGSFEKPNMKLIGKTARVIVDNRDIIHEGKLTEMILPFDFKINEEWWTVADAMDCFLEDDIVYLDCATRAEENK